MLSLAGAFQLEKAIAEPIIINIIIIRAPINLLFRFFPLLPSFIRFLLDLFLFDSPLFYLKSNYNSNIYIFKLLNFTLIMKLIKIYIKIRAIT